MRGRLWYFERAPFEAAIAVAALAGAIAYLIDPGAVAKSAAGHTLGILLPAWEVLWGISGLLILFGLVRLSVRAEATGLVTFAAALVINALSIASFSGAQGAASAATFAALGAACAIRVRFLWRAWKRMKELGE